MRYASGLALAPELCAGVVFADTIEEGGERILALLHQFSPEVEPARDEPGIFWVNVAGLTRLYTSLEAWSCRLHSALSRLGFAARIAVGFSRFGTGAIVRAQVDEPTLVLASPDDERERLQQVPLGRLRLGPSIRDELHALGVDTLGAFMKLPAAGLRKRYGDDAHRLHALAAGERSVPLSPAPEIEPITEHLVLDDAETDITRLVFRIKFLLHPLLRALAARHQALAELSIRLELENKLERTERLCPAEPTLDARQLLNLVHLRLEASGLEAGVEEIALDATGVPATAEQLTLFREHPTRDLAAAKQAFAWLRAEFGDGAVVRARLREGHLPEASFALEPVAAMPAPQPREVAARTLVRRVYARPLPLPHRPRHEEDGWLVRGHDDVAADTVIGPYIVSGGWWRREVHREYHFVRNQRGEWLWVFYDRSRQRWFLHGRVE
jgi:protein ImuB